MRHSLPIVTSQADTGHLFLVGPWKRSFWVARDLEGQSEGIFRDRKEALRFALREGGHANAVLLSPNEVAPTFGRGIC